MKNNYKYFILLLLSVFLIISCKKGLDQITIESKVYLPLSGLSTQTPLLGESIYELGVYKSGVNQKNAKVTVTLKVDQNAFNEFLDANPGYELLPETYYTIPSETVTIEKGEDIGFFKIHLRGINETFANKNYILPVSIATVSPNVEIVDEKRIALLNFPNYRNAFECKYKAFGKISPTDDRSALDIVDEIVGATSLSANTIWVHGGENNLNLNLTVKKNEVLIQSTPDLSEYNITNTVGKTSTYTGSFDPIHQMNKGIFKLYYTFIQDGIQMEAEIELQFWL